MSSRLALSGIIRSELRDDADLFRAVARVSRKRGPDLAHVRTLAARTGCIDTLRRRAGARTPIPHIAMVVP